MEKKLFRVFDTLKMKNPPWSSYICFVEAISGEKMDRSTLRKLFKKFVSREDYEEVPQKELLDSIETHNLSR